MSTTLLHRSIATLLALVPLAALSAGCGGGVAIVRGSQVEGLDDQAMSTGMDRRDIQQALHENLKSMMTSPTANGWAQDHSRPTVAIYPLANETSEHIEGQLNALLSDVETYLVETSLVTVVSVERQQQMIAEVEKQHGGGFDPRHVADYNRQLGAKYYVTGKVFTADERAFGERRVQYFMFMQLIEVATSAVVWQHKVDFTKAIIRS
jgi:PBP1b-binding outer membrane lipoprotein LpoB